MLCVRYLLGTCRVDDLNRQWRCAGSARTHTHKHTYSEPCWVETMNGAIDCEVMMDRTIGDGQE